MHVDPVVRNARPVPHVQDTVADQVISRLGALWSSNEEIPVSSSATERAETPGPAKDRRRWRRSSAAFGQEHRQRRRKAFLVLLVLLVGSGTAVMGTVSTFTEAETGTQTLGTGTFGLDLANPSAPSQFSVNISGLAPGDFADRLVDVSNSGSINFASVALGITATTSSLLDTDATNGLRLQIDACSVAWTQASAGVAATCGAITTNLTASTAVSALKAAGPSYTSSFNSLTAAGLDRLRFHYSLPAASVGTAGLSSVLVYTFTATQVAGGAYH